MHARRRTHLAGGIPRGFPDYRVVCHNLITLAMEGRPFAIRLFDPANLRTWCTCINPAYRNLPTVEKQESLPVRVGTAELEYECYLLEVIIAD